MNLFLTFLISVTSLIVSQGFILNCPSKQLAQDIVLGTTVVPPFAEIERNKFVALGGLTCGRVGEIIFERRVLAVGPPARKPIKLPTPVFTPRPMTLEPSVSPVSAPSFSPRIRTLSPSKNPSVSPTPQLRTPAAIFRFSVPESGEYMAATGFSSDLKTCLLDAKNINASVVGCDTDCFSGDFSPCSKFTFIRNRGDEVFIYFSTVDSKTWEITTSIQIKLLSLTPTTSNPTKQPSRNPTKQPSRNPTKQPSRNPTKQPSRNPTKQPSRNPTKQPSRNPTKQPSRNPTYLPSRTPTVISPSQNPTKRPTELPPTAPPLPPTAPPSTRNPTVLPSINPTRPPLRSQTEIPSINPTKPPLKSSTKSPSFPIISTTPSPFHPLSNSSISPKFPVESFSPTQSESSTAQTNSSSQNQLNVGGIAAGSTVAALIVMAAIVMFGVHQLKRTPTLGILVTDERLRNSLSNNPQFQPLRS